MSDLQAYISDRKKRDPEFAEGYDEGFRSFKIGVLLKQAREEAGLTQDELAKQLNTKKTAISRIENHAEDIRLSTVEKQPLASRKKLRVELVEGGRHNHRFNTEVAAVCRVKIWCLIERLSFN